MFGGLPSGSWLNRDYPPFKGSLSLFNLDHHTSYSRLKAKVLELVR